MPSPYDSAEYKRNRAAILIGNPDCALCGRPGADTADHIIPLMHGGDNRLDNLRPAHARCNSLKGSRDQAKAAHSRQAARERALTRNDFFTANDTTPAPLDSLFLRNQPEPAGTSPDQPSAAPTGQEQPRLESARVGGQSLGPAVATWAEQHLMPLMPWQVYALTGMLEADGTDLLRRESLVSTARQQGKSVLLTALIGWWLTEGARVFGCPQTVMSTANQLDRAEAIFNNLAHILVDKFGGKSLQAIGRKRVTMPDGSSWEIRAASTRLHGGSYDLIVVDELWNIAPAVVDEALRPSMIARPHPLLACFSTAGDASSTAMINMRETALTELEHGTLSQLYFAEWSMPLGADWRDERWWGWANPALGTTVTIEALRAAAARDSFLRAHLNQWITTRGAMLDPGVWDGCVTSDAIPDGGVLAIDSSVDDARYVGTRAVTVGDGVMVQAAFVVESEADMWLEVERLMADRTLQLAVTPTLDIHVPEQLRRRSTVVGYGELIRWTSLVRGMIQQGKVAHTGSAVLAEHVNRAVGVKTAQGYVVSSQKSPGPIELARCLIWAVALVSRPQTKQKPMLVVHG